ncbi:lysozyme inhibitor LprI family protein [Microvirga solisilvae]|uniref:lysozyme inhibitor LprI family protein n=1 Tax=Microvirga solisilvae TaxID=2919498 RepID=UPI001FAEBD10|nr:lysozyme inhibitor LprI family protein [Microvirga solisilvae]
MRRLIFFLPFLISLPALAASGDDPASIEPTGSEKQIILSCVEAASSLIEQRQCIKRVADACNEGTNPEVKPRSRTRTCVQAEERIWDELLNRWYREKASLLSGRGLEALRKAQQTWIAYRDAKCGLFSVIQDGALGFDNAFLCRLEETAHRALEIRDLDIM